MKEFSQTVRLLLAWSALIFLLAGGAHAQDEPSDEPTPAQTTSPTADNPADSLDTSPTIGGRLGPDYILGSEDVLEISVLDVPELKETARVDNDGVIVVKLLGRVKAAGLTTRQLQAELEKEWGKNYLQDPVVTVFIKEFHACPVSVIGAVEKPGVYEVPARRTLIEVLSMAGGLAKRSSGAAGRYVVVTRKAGFQDLPDVRGLRELAPGQVQIDLRQLMLSHDDALNIEIKPFDVVAVGRAGVVYVVGEVRKPGGFILEDRDSVTVLQALAMAEGFGLNPNKKAGRIVRRGENGSISDIPVDLGKVMQGKADDIVLAANDILIVPDSTGKYIGKRGVETAITTITGIAIWRGF